MFPTCQITECIFKLHIYFSTTNPITLKRYRNPQQCPYVSHTVISIFIWFHDFSTFIITLNSISLFVEKVKSFQRASMSIWYLINYFNSNHNSRNYFNFVMNYFFFFLHNNHSSNAIQPPIDILYNYPIYFFNI